MMSYYKLITMRSHFRGCFAVYLVSWTFSFGLDTAIRFVMGCLSVVIYEFSAEDNKPNKLFSPSSLFH